MWTAWIALIPTGWKETEYFIILLVIYNFYYYIYVDKITIIKGIYMGKLDKVKVELKRLDPPGNVSWLAKKIGIHQSLLSNYDKGRSPLAYHRKVQIANIFRGVKIEDLFDDIK